MGFTIVWLLYVWSYFKVRVLKIGPLRISPHSQMILAGPGFARDVGLFVHGGTPIPLKHSQRVPSVQCPGQPSIEDVPHPPLPVPASISPATSFAQATLSESVGPDPSEFAAVANLYADTLQAPAAHPSSSATLAGSTPHMGQKGRKDPNEVERPVPNLETGPRWCKFCEINKPDRTHHCRHCGTCIMQFDRESDSCSEA